MKPLALVLAVCASAFAQTVWTGTWSNGMSSMAGVRFEFRTEPPDPPLRFSGSSSGRTVYRAPGGYMATHRYFRDDSNHTYVGYDLLVEQQTQPPDTFKITFLELGIGPLEFAVTPNGNADPSTWKKLATPTLPESRIVHTGDKVELAVWVNPANNQRLIDVIQVQQSPSALAPQALVAPQMSPQMGMLRSSVLPARSMPSVPTVEGTAREFRADDAEMHLAQPRVTLNGTPDVSSMRGGNIANGTLVWFYLPKHGRYILSLVPRPELGFTKAGEVRGGAIKFKLDGDDFLVETYQPVAPGSAPYVLYALHDKDFEPTARNQADRMLYGSVSPAELVALFKK